MDILNYFIIIILMLISSQYNYDFFSIFIIIIYSLFNPGYSNLLFILIFFIILFLKHDALNPTSLGFLGITGVIVLLSAMFGSRKRVSDDGEEDSGSYENLLKMLGKQ